MLPDHFVLLGDVVSSRHIANREEFQSRLKRACAKASELYKSSLFTKIKLIKGADELGGVLTSWRDAFSIINFILDEIHPYQIRFAVVQGTIDVGETTRDVSLMDGPAFHEASRTIGALKQRGILFQLVTNNKVTDLSVSNQISMLLMLRQRWTAKHHQVVMLQRSNHTQKQIASALDISQQAVSKLLKQINWKQYAIMEDLLKQQVELLCDGDCDADPSS